MKKRKFALCIALATTMALTPALCACSSDNYTEIDFPKDQNTSYAVTSQGGSVVQYGNYMYFINGTRGYDDKKGESNIWNKVVKGGLYRAKLNEDKSVQYADDLPYKGFTPLLNAEYGHEFAAKDGEDYFGKPINVVDVTKIAPKTIGTSGYADGGIFIYDNYVYFASPNNEQDSLGKVRTDRTDFFMMSLKGGAPVKVYTTSEKKDTSSSAYAFYKYRGAVYLVVNEGSNIVSVRINVADEKADDPVTFKVKATSVYFPVRDTYYKGIDNTTVEDFIYFVRETNDKDKEHSGTVIEAMRPDGKEKFIVSETGKTETIEAVRDGVFFWRTQNQYGESVIAYDNLQAQRYQYSASYKKAQDKLLANAETAHLADRSIHGMFDTNITSSITSTYAFRPNNDAQSNEVFFAAATSGALYVYDTENNARVVTSGSTGTLLFEKEGYLYYTTGSDYSRVPLYENMDGYGGEAQQLATETVSAGISCDYAAGYFSYFGFVDQWADGYTLFYKVDGYEGLSPQFVGKRIKADIPSDDDIEDAKK